MQVPYFFCRFCGGNDGCDLYGHCEQRLAASSITVSLSRVLIGEQPKVVVGTARCIPKFSEGPPCHVTQVSESNCRPLGMRC